MYIGHLYHLKNLQNKSLNINILEHNNKLLVLVKIKILLTILRRVLFTIKIAFF